MPPVRASDQVPQWHFSFTFAQGQMELEAFKKHHVPMKKDFSRRAKKFVFQLEQGEQQGGYHYQGHLNMKQKIRALTLARKLGSGVCPGIQVQLSSAPGKEALQDYCMKEDTRIAGPWADRPIYRGQDIAVVSDSPRPWQQDILDMIAAEPDDRSIICIIDPVGNKGKSKLVKYLVYNKKAKSMGMGNANQIKTNVCNQGASTCYLLDIPRTTGDNEPWRAMVSAIEAVKNGMVQSTMYGNDNMLTMMPPHVIIFTNSQPHLGRMSMDRWKLKTITADYKLKTWLPENQGAPPLPNAGGHVAGHFNLIPAAAPHVVPIVDGDEPNELDVAAPLAAAALEAALAADVNFGHENEPNEYIVDDEDDIEEDENILMAFTDSIGQEYTDYPLRRSNALPRPTNPVGAQLDA